MLKLFLILKIFSDFLSISSEIKKISPYNIEHIFHIVKFYMGYAIFWHTYDTWDIPNGFLYMGIFFWDLQKQKNSYGISRHIFISWKIFSVLYGFHFSFQFGTGYLTLMRNSLTNESREGGDLYNEIHHLSCLMNIEHFECLI